MKCHTTLTWNHDNAGDDVLELRELQVELIHPLPTWPEKMWRTFVIGWSMEWL